MKQSVVSIFLMFSSIFTWSVAGFSQQKCVDVLSSTRPLLEKAAVVDLFNEMKRLEKHLNFREKLNGNSLSAALKDIRNRGRLMVLNLGLHDSEAVITTYRKLFRETEMAYLSMQQHQEQFVKLGPEADQAEVLKLHEAIAKNAEILGKNYSEYSIIRRVLEAIVEKNTEVIEYFNIRVGESGKTQSESAPTAEGTARENEIIFDAINRVDLSDEALVKTAAYSLTRMGIFAEREAFGHVFETKLTEENLKSMLSMPSIQHFYRTNPQVIVAKIRQDLKREGTLLYKLISTSFLQAFNRLGDSINRVMPAKVAKVIFWLAGITRDQYVLDLYLNDIEEVLQWRRPTEQKVHLLMDYSAGKPNDEMLVTFARIAVFSPGWVEMRKAVEKLCQTSDVYKSFHERMLKAETTVRDIGQLSLYSHKKWSATMPTFIVSTAALASQHTEDFSQALHYLGSFVGLQ